MHRLNPQGLAKRVGGSCPNIRELFTPRKLLKCLEEIDYFVGDSCLSLSNRDGEWPKKFAGTFQGNPVTLGIHQGGGYFIEAENEKIANAYKRTLIKTIRDHYSDFITLC
ncbi:hypothetical protein GF386_00470 [Candidatus Pacearchaeota archaeon]|nr:hypothetical protein [Candidatus Pacearchaeota archaeon]